MADYKESDGCPLDDIYSDGMILTTMIDNADDRVNIFRWRLTLTRIVNTIFFVSQGEWAYLLYPYERETPHICQDS